MNIKKKLPPLNQLAPVYGVISIFVYSWTIVWFFWKLNGWLVYLNLGEIGVIFIYSLATNLLESLFVLSVPVLMGMILPSRWYLDHFISRSTAWLLPGLSYLVFVAYQFEGRSKFHQSLIIQVGLPVLALIILFIAASIKWPRVGRTLEDLADRTTILLFLFLPISVLSLVIVILRNII